MIKDDQKWHLGISKLTSFMQYIHAPYEEDNVVQYHEILTVLEQASDENLSDFRIPAEKLKPRPIGAQRTSYSGRPGRVQYSDKKFCDAGYFNSQIGALGNYVQLVIAKTGKGKTIIRAEQGPSKPHLPPGSNYTHIEMHNSALMQGSPGSTINQHFSVSSQEFKTFVGTLRSQLGQIDLVDDDRAQANADLSTIESQIASPKPKPGVIRECMTSIRTILENVAGNVIAAGIISTISQYFPR